jgi:hypothetical protein
LAVAIPAAAVGQTQHSSDSHTPRQFARAAETTFQKGVHANLPPHLSTLLGISKEEECPVLQSAVRAGNQVQGIDVLVKNEKDIVLFVVDETVNDQDLYLTSPEGILRRVVSVKAGVGSVVPINDKEKDAFKKEKQFWIDRLVRSVTTK